MVTRIIMNEDFNVGEKTFLAGEVYDSRFPSDTPAAEDGIQHSISADLLDLFLSQGLAHEETSDEWWLRVEMRRKKSLSDPNVAESTKQLILAQDTACLPLVAIFRPQPTRGSLPTNPATLAAIGEAL